MAQIKEILLENVIEEQNKNESESVSFNTFFENQFINQLSKIKESSLIVQMQKPNNFKTDSDNYKRYMNENEINDENNTKVSKILCLNRFNILLLLWLLLIMSLCVIFVFIYVLHCFDFLQVHLSDKNQPYNNYIRDNDDDDYYNHISNDKFEIERKPLPPPPSPDYNQCKLVPVSNRFDCHPEPGSHPNRCETRGCCWIPLSNNIHHQNVPFCFYPPQYGGYKYRNVTKTASGYQAYLERTFRSPYVKDVRVLKMIVVFETEWRLRVKLIDAERTRYETPYPEVPVVDRPAAVQTAYYVRIESDYGFQIVRKSDETVIFDSLRIGGLIYSDQFLQLSALLPSHYIYGLGEHRSNLLLSTNWQTFTMFNADQYPIDNSNLYGSHPMYLMIEPSGNAHGVFLLNSNAMDVILQPGPAITFRPIGGVFDFYFFLGPTPANVIQQYTDLIGRPMLPPQWSLGFHLCRFGYRTLNETETVWKRTVDAQIPFDVQWNDLDYMQSRNDFTYNRSTFRGLPEFVQKLHAVNMHYVPIIDPGISGSEPVGTYPPYDVGMRMGIFVKNASGLPFVGKVWNRASTVWPDFTDPKTVDYWTRMLRAMHADFAYDGAWIDMNEPSNFLSGSVNGCPENSTTYEHPEYVPHVQAGLLSHKTMCMTCQQFAGLHYDVHNLFGFTEAIITNFALSEIRGKRPFVISRSTFPGLGRYAGHWSGDIWSTWDDMKYTIPKLLSFSLFGVPLMGADICGFNGNTTAALCNRWMQLGAFYPFARNHNTDDGVDQDPVALGSEVVDSSRKALQMRYALLPYLYTLFWKAHTQGDTVATPLFFEFINDTKTYSIDEQFLWGKHIMIIPVLNENVTRLEAYFPASIWYNYETYEMIKSPGAVYNVSAAYDTVPVYVRGGAIIPQHTAAANVPLTRRTKIRLLATSDQDSNANGLLYWDDGDSLNSVEELCFTLVNMSMRAGELSVHAMWWYGGEETEPPPLGQVIVLGLFTAVKSVTINQIEHNFSYNTIKKFLLIDDLNMSMKNNIRIQWK